MASGFRDRLQRSLKGLQRETAEALRMDPRGGSPQLRPLPILELTRPSSLKDVVVGCDADVGGLSTVQLAITADSPKDYYAMQAAQKRTEQSQKGLDGVAKKRGGKWKGKAVATEEPRGKGLFRGILRAEMSSEAKVKGGLEKGGYAAFRTRMRRTLMGEELWDTEMHKYLRLRVRYSGDGMRYFVNIQTTSPVATDLYQHRLWMGRANEWEDVLVRPSLPQTSPSPHPDPAQIPLADFALTNRGRISPHQIPMARDSVRTVGISVIEKEGPFELGIEKIDCVSDESLEAERRERLEGPEEMAARRVSEGEVGGS